MCYQGPLWLGEVAGLLLVCVGWLCNQPLVVGGQLCQALLPRCAVPATRHVAQQGLAAIAKSPTYLPGVGGVLADERTTCGSMHVWLSDGCVRAGGGAEGGVQGRAQRG